MLFCLRLMLRLKTHFFKKKRRFKHGSSSQMCKIINIFIILYLRVLGGSRPLLVCRTCPQTCSLRGLAFTHWTVFSVFVTQTEETMFGFHKSKIYRSNEGCCICKTKSSSSRFTDSGRYEETFRLCFG